jgi:kynurenine formamidase
MIDISTLNPIDLTLPLKSGMRGFNSETANTVSDHGWNATLLHIYSHCGTHMDAPLHFEASPATIDQYPVSRFIGKAWRVKVSITEPNQSIGPEQLGDVADKFEAGDSLLLETQWSQNVTEPKYRDELPRISEELAEWCVSNKVNMLGVEPPSVADVNNLKELTAVHKILLTGGVIIIEGLTNLHSIINEEVILVALPLKVEGCDGAPARVIAFDINS